ncbi:hypothetical protein Bcep18194_C6732 [Burkholderia lata]|uniref:Uncharacterized protein n=1 Tax=Burkholderia lata (strain ATCC 17760 / DSM 23089 / LMG 22485 / NCIMB 9086 / R18194 / 383) TaxID=482957 RepID=Q39P35_BURL3|nr:hypothetical protein Bcep18194_C6732 [Burkholderia lata]
MSRGSRGTGRTRRRFLSGEAAAISRARTRAMFCVNVDGLASLSEDVCRIESCLAERDRFDSEVMTTLASRRARTDRAEPADARVARSRRHDVTTHG